MLRVNQLCGFANKKHGGVFPSGLTVWARYKASSLAPGIADGGAVGTWTDISGNARDAIQLTAARKPLLRYTASGLSGNRYGVEFRGTNGDPHQMQLPSMTALTEGEIFFWVKKDDDDGTNARRLHQIGSATDFYYVYLDHQIYDGFGSTVRKTAGDPSPSLTAWHMYSVRSKSSDWQCYVNNSSVFSTGTNTVGFPSNPQIGGHVSGTTGTRLCNGTIAEIVILSTATDATGRANIYRYFLDEYS